MKKMRVLIKRPDEQYGHVCNISDRLENLQKTVKGPIEIMEITRSADDKPILTKKTNTSRREVWVKNE